MSVNFSRFRCDRRLLPLGALLAVLSLFPTALQAQTFTHYSNIDDMTGWGSCDACSGPNGAGATIPHWMAQNQSSPSKDGASTEFFVGGTASYASALWNRQLGANDNVRHFYLSLDFYFSDQKGPQAIEIDTWQSVNGHRYLFGAECDVQGTYAGQWMVNDFANNKWISTGIPCLAATAGKWHHIGWEYSRTLDNRMHYQAVTVDGVKYMVDRFYSPHSTTTRELNVAIQLDGDKEMTNYSVWVDNVNLTAW
jgi:hypothetical protein